MSILDEVIRFCQDSVEPASKILAYHKDLADTEINHDNFKLIPTKERKTLIFIDGGNNTLHRSSNLLVEIHKIGAVICNKTKEKIQRQVFEYFTITRTVMEDNRLKIQSRLISSDNLPEELQTQKTWDYHDTELTTDSKLKDASGTIRKENEHAVALSLAENHRDSIIVLDGNVIPKTEACKELNKKISIRASDNNNTVLGLAKTSTVYADNGRSVQSELSSRTQLPVWYYEDLCKGSIKTFCTKLHPASKHIFLIECLNISHRPDIIFSSLKMNSKDGAFPGYPYGLIAVDQLARVPHEFADFLKAQLHTKQAELEKQETSHNAHEILDNM